jgi:uncharacterized protein YndB with AHSA1/START domain
MDSKADKFEFRIGGREKTTQAGSSGEVFTFDTLYQEIVPNQRIVYSHTLDFNQTRISASLTTVEFKSISTGTRLIYTEQVVILDGYYTVREQEYRTNTLLDNLGYELGTY